VEGVHELWSISASHTLLYSVQPMIPLELAMQSDIAAYEGRSSANMKSATMTTGLSYGKLKNHILSTSNIVLGGTNADIQHKTSTRQPE
jgi:hypothetical protein